jgi:cell division protein FtsL
MRREAVGLSGPGKSPRALEEGFVGMGKSFDRKDRILWMDDGLKPRSSAQRSKLLLLTLFIFCLIVASLFYVWSRVQVIRLGYEISSVLKEEKRLGETNKRLKVEIAALKSYSRIEKLAVEELRMSKPSADQVIVIR